MVSLSLSRYSIRGLARLMELSWCYDDTSNQRSIFQIGCFVHLRITIIYDVWACVLVCTYAYGFRNRHVHVYVFMYLGLDVRVRTHTYVSARTLELVDAHKSHAYAFTNTRILTLQIFQSPWSVLSIVQAGAAARPVCNFHWFAFGHMCNAPIHSTDSFICSALLISMTMCLSVEVKQLFAWALFVTQPKCKSVVDISGTMPRLTKAVKPKLTANRDKCLA